jgi:hypothetical protein
METLVDGRVMARVAQLVAQRVERNEFPVEVRGVRYTLAGPVVRDLAISLQVPLEEVQRAVVDAEVAGLIETHHGDEHTPLLLRAVLL